jgi:hypothetical protein
MDRKRVLRTLRKAEISKELRDVARKPRIPGGTPVLRAGREDKLSRYMRRDDVLSVERFQLGEQAWANNALVDVDCS